MPLIVLYDPEENDRSDRLDAYPMDHPDRRIHYWAMREGNPFEDLKVLWIDRQLETSTGEPVFSNIISCVYTNIDHMYIWVEDDIFPEREGWITDTSEDFILTTDQINFLMELTVENVFLAVEMTEQLAWSTNALQRIDRLIQCAESNIPTIYAIPGQGYRSHNWPTGRRGRVNPNAGDDNGHAYWWRITRDAVEDLIARDEEITRDTIQQIIGTELPPTGGDFGGVKLEPFCKWTTQFALTLWDTFNSIMYIERLPTAFAYVPEGYAWSGTQLGTLFSVIESEIERARGVESAEDWNTRWSALKLQQRDFRRDQLNPTRTRNVSQLLRIRDYDRIMEQNGYPCTTFRAYSERRDRTSTEQHFSLRTKSGAYGLNRVYAIQGNDSEERIQSILDWLNTNDHFAFPQHGQNFSTDGHRETIANPLMDVLLRRSTILVTRIEHKPAASMPISHTNMCLMMRYLDLQYCRDDADEDTLETRPNAGALSPYSRRHILATFFQNMSSREYFSRSYFTGHAAAGWMTWARNSDMLIFTDGIFLGEMWWPEGVSQLAEVPQISG